MAYPTAASGIGTQPAPGTPQTTNTTGYNPALMSAITQPAYLQGVAGYNPSYASYDPAQAHTLGGRLLRMLSPQSTINQLQTSMIPQTQSAYQNLNQQLADFGVQGGQAIQAGDQLSGNLTSAIAPAMASAIQNAQANRLGAGEFNQGAKNQMGLANSQEALQAALANAGFANQAGQFNATNQNQANQFNVGEQNQYNQMLMAAIMNNYNQQMGDVYGMGQTMQQGATQQGLNYGQEVTQNPGFFSEMMGGITGLAGAAAPFFNPFGSLFGGGGQYPSDSQIQNNIGPTPPAWPSF